MERGKEMPNKARTSFPAMIGKGIAELRQRTGPAQRVQLSSSASGCCRSSPSHLKSFLTLDLTGQAAGMCSLCSGAVQSTTSLE